MKYAKFIDFLIVMSLIATSGCSNADEDERKAKEVIASMTLKWTTLKDGSKFVQANPFPNSTSMPSTMDAARCWQNAKSGVDCIHATEINAGFSVIRVSRQHHDTLPDLSLALAEEGKGYSCDHVSRYAEKISTGQDDLVTNRPDYDTERWDASFVNRYIADNGVAGSKYFDCLAILEAVNLGSLATLGTTTITRRMISSQ